MIEPHRPLRERLRCAGLALAALLAGCGTDALPGAIVAVAPTSAPARSTTFACAVPRPPCDTTARGDLDELIARGRERVVATKFKDAAVIVDVARLELQRGSAADALSSGRKDAEGALLDAARAIAADASDPGSRMVLALALANRISAQLDHPDVHVRSVALGLLRGLAPTGAKGPIGAAAHAFDGYVALREGDVQRARGAFRVAVELGPNLPSAWLGYGDAARADGAIDPARDAFLRASKVPTPTGEADPEVGWSIAAADRGELLAILRTRARAPDPSDASPRTRARCADPSETTAELCSALAALSKASAPADLIRVAGDVMKAYEPLREICDTHRSTCTEDVTLALLEAARALFEAGAFLKATAIGQLIIDPARALPGVKLIEAQLERDLGVWYAAGGVFDQSASWRARRDDRSGRSLAGAHAGARDPIALGHAEQAMKDAAGIAAMGPLDDDDAELVRATFALAASSTGVDAAQAWARSTVPALASEACARSRAACERVPAGLGVHRAAHRGRALERTRAVMGQGAAEKS
ncbi:MAG: hypothetical protein U0414_43220 [Polyangiaceae bacterium]